MATEQPSAIDDILAEYAGLQEQLSDPALHDDAATARRVAKRFAELGPVMSTYTKLAAARDDLAAATELAADDASFAEEVPVLAQQVETLDAALTDLLAPRDPHDADDVVLEVRPGAGGEESALFAADLVRMYLKYCERHGWKAQVLGITESDLGGYKEATLSIRAPQATRDGVWSRLKFEGGVHRVQRVPVTESQGRIHTSAATVAVLPEAEEVDVRIEDKDLRIDVYRSSGPGGQSVNTTDSAVRLTHIPTGVVVTCQNEKSQLQNKVSAMRVLQAKLLERKRQEERAELDALKGDGGSSWGNQMRSYVLHPYQMVKDLRTNLENNNPTAVLDGEIDDFIEAGIRWRMADGGNDAD